uniref:Phosphodiesterase n=1 Tax=Phallusia mammillata TaxID=59560 RepID=A0A6F9DMS8_9ASCI|nr:cGMP-inhibited 3',5'-cyclic phosphodiesterase A [Phallusia mammillata]
MWDVAVEYGMCFTVLMGGVCLITNTASIMSKSLFKIYLTQNTTACRCSRQSQETVYLVPQKEYFENNITSSHMNAGCMHLRQRKVPIAKANNISETVKKQETEKESIDCHHSTSDKQDFSGFNNMFLIYLLLISCMLENFGIVWLGLHSQSEATFPSCCNASSSSVDCFSYSHGIILHKHYLPSFLCTLALCAFTTFPISVILTKHCYSRWPRCLLSSIIFVFSIVMSRCFAFFLLPSLLRDKAYNFIIERLLSTWLVCFFMCLGVRFSRSTSPKASVQRTIQTIGDFHACSDPDHNLPAPMHHIAPQDEFTAKTNFMAKPPKRTIRRSLSDLALTSDSFMPCVVLMKKQTANVYKTHTNIGTMPRPARVRRRASLDVIKENNNVKDATKWSNMMARRRTSLPAILASSKRKAVMSSVLVDTATLVDVQSKLEDLSKDPSNANDVIKKLQELLRPYKTDHIKPRQVVWLHDSTTDGSDEDSGCVSPRHLGKRSVRRSDWPGTQRDIFSTTTTATGLPTEEPAPEKPKRLPKVAKDKTPINSPFESRGSSPTCDGPISTGMGRRKTFPYIPGHVTQSFFAPNSVNTEKQLASAGYGSYDTEVPTTRILAVRSKSVNEADGGERSPTEITLTPPSDVNELPSVLPPFCEILEEDERCHSNLDDDEGNLLFDDYQGAVLETVYNWNFQIFELSDQTPCVLSQMAFKLFQDTGLFDTFRIPKKEFVQYMVELERGYQLIPYHNRIHAADVLHGCWFLSTQDIPGFQDYYPLFSSDSSDSDSGTGTSQTRHVNNIGHGSLAQAIPALELMSLYLAAAMHDYDHPGRTNAFLVETRDPLAILYNDRSVLENHHASASWELLYSNKNFDFLQNLTTAEWKRLRFLIVEAILATDLKKHFEILSQFTAKSQRPHPPSEDDSDSNTLKKSGINWSADEDRLLVCQMVIKLADIGGPAKLRDLHITWTKAICEEFFIQGDKERELGVPVSPFMDRNKPQVAELQRTFINNLIKPIVTGMHKTGILAGAVADEGDDAMESGQSPKKSLLLEQLKENLNFWKSNNFTSGQEEMEEAFKLALPVDLKLPRRDMDRSQTAIVHPQPIRPRYRASGTQMANENDDVFESRLNERLPDVIDTSSSFSSPIAETVVHPNALQRQTHK